jgi:hypothetical protein
MDSWWTLVSSSTKEPPGSGSAELIASGFITARTIATIVDLNTRRTSQE